MNICRKIIYKNFQRKLTVACDLSPFYHPYNEREQLFHKNGFLSAKRFCKKWVKDHPNGQARIIYGHVNWKD